MARTQSRNSKACEVRLRGRIRNARFLIGACLWLGLALVPASTAGGDPNAQSGPSSEPQFQQLIRSVEGPDLFRAYCASCHGSDGKGHGPAAPALKTRVADLTVLAKRNGGQFPSDRVRRTISGDRVLDSHGSREMPIWGPIFHQIETDVDRGNVRMENLLNYLESIQAIDPAREPAKKVLGIKETDPSGEQLYKQNCAACHGADLKGGGSAPYPFRVPPDLTTLAQRHGGKFPDAYVSDVLQNGVKIPAHGPAEMPIWGTDFRARDQLNAKQVQSRVANLSSYIKSLQAK